MSLSILPSDSLFDIFILLDNLQDLHAIASISRAPHQAFCDHRARVLQHVFHNQIIKRRDDHLARPALARDVWLRPGSPAPGVVLQYITPIIVRYEKKRLPDPLILRSTAWATFIGFKSPEWVFTSLGKELVSLCRTVGREDLALSYAAELWKHVSTRQTFEYLIMRNRFALDRDANSFARDLAERYYNDFKRPENAARTILECYDMGIRGHDYKLFSYILKYSRDMVDPSEVLSFFRERAATERDALVANGIANGDLHWIFCLTLLLSELGKVQDAICVFNNTYDLYPDDRLDPVTLEGLSRRLIKSLKTQNHYDEAFTIHRQILALLSRMHRTTSSKYMAWANQYISELYAVGRSNEALAVEEQCWNRIRERLAIGKELSSVYAGRGAAWALCRSYQRRGQPEQAMRVRWEYETLSKACMKPGSRVIWPGEDGGEYVVGTGTEQRREERFLPFQAAHGSSIQV